MVLGKLSRRIKKLSVHSNTSESDSDSTDVSDSGDSTSDSESSLSSETDSNNVPKDPRDRIVQKPKESETHYRVMTLKNGMQCLLISDAEEAKSESAAYRALEVSTTDKAAVALAVRVGSAHDPRHLPGLAHFLEHMLFMGCKKYPDENEYDQFLDNHGGSSNATTDMETTCYMFDVSAEHLEGAIDRFAHQFIAPLLRKSSVKREVKAVDSEYMEGLQKDSEKISSIMTSLLQPDHPYFGFSCGNRESLVVNPKKQNVDVLAELRKFYDKYYSANLMCLCISSSHPLKKLEKMTKVFEQIPNKKIPIPTLENLPIPVTRCNFVKYCPVKDKKKIFFSWFLPPQNKHFRAKPVEYVEFLLGHEGRGSLISALKHKGYATEIECQSALGGLDSGTNFTRFLLDITLSDTGLEDYREVIKLVFQYIQMMRNKLPCERIFNEMKTMRDIDFDYSENDDPFETVEDLVENMTLFPPENYLNGPEQIFEYKPDLIMDVVNSLTPDRMFVVLQSPTFKGICTEVEKWNRGSYFEGNFDTDFIDMLKTASPKVLPFFKSEFKLPEPNKYIPEDFEVKESDVEGPETFPVVITDEPTHKVWFHVDDVFEEPECVVNLHLFSKRVCENVRTYAINCLYVELYCQRTAELFYSAGLAGLSSTVEVEREGFRFCYDGYSDKMFKFFKATLEEFLNAAENNFNFAAVKDSVVKRLRTSKLKPVKHSEDIRLSFLSSTHITCDHMADVLENITEDDIRNHDIRKMGGFYLEAFCSGNMMSSDVEAYIRCFNKKIGLVKDPMTSEQFRQERVMKFPLGRHVYRVPNSNPNDLNTSVVNYYQHTTVSFRDVVLLGVLEELMQEPLFNQLRTRLQMGYSVSAESHQTFGITGFSISVQTQANKFSAKEANIYIETFLSWFTQYLVVMTEKNFKDRVSEMIKNKISPTHTMDDECDQIWTEILIQEYIFDRDQRTAEVMKQLTKGEVMSFCHNLFFENTRKLSVQVEGNPKGTSSKDKDGEDSDDDSSSASEKSAPKKNCSVPNMTFLSKGAISNWSEDIKAVQSVEEFHRNCELSPVYKMVTKVVTVDVTNKVN